MQNKNNVALLVGVGFVGILIGWLMFGQTKVQEALWGTRGVGHMMPDNSMMKGDKNSMASMMHMMNAGLEGKTGDAFDQEFIEEMIVHHQGAIDMARLALTNAKHKEIKDLATAIISAQNDEIAQMKTWLKGWYNVEVK